ncbi:MAG: hypothetical protein J6L96_03240, partial [Clostridia bacterium]|nr:hypothetical protein [Clostridia bacterium]
KFFNSITTKISAMATRAKTAVTSAVTYTAGEGYVDSGVKILIAVVIGALLLAGLYALFNTTIMPTVTSKITELFNFAG